MNARITIEPMRAAHVPEILRIEQASFATPWTLDMFVQELGGHEFSRAYVAVCDGVVAGYEIAWFIHEEVHLLNIAVAPSMRRQGIARQLMMRLIEQALAENRRWITLEVREKNDAAQALYRAFAFHPIGLRKNYYEAEGEDAVLFALELESHGDPDNEELVDDEE